MTESKQPGGRKVIAGIFHNRSALEKTIEDLMSSGVARERISVVVPSEKNAERDAAKLSTPESKSAASGAEGAATGAVIGGTAGILAGLGLLAVPGIGPLLAAGPIVSGLSGAAAGTTVGGLVGTLVGLGVGPEEANLYEKAVRENGILLIVGCDNEVECDRWRSRLESGGAEQVSGHGFPQADIMDDLMFF